MPTETNPGAGALGAGRPPPKYDGFISYSHAVDGRLAPGIQRALHALAKPWYRLRALHVFRDETSLSANPALWSSIEKALSVSRWFIYLASPRAAESPWVRREIQWWLANRGSSSMLIALTEGTLAWDEVGGDFAWSVTDAFPREFAGMLAGEPLWVDLSWARSADNLSLRHSQFRAAVLRLASPMHGRAPDELDGDDVRAHRRNRLTAQAAIAVLVALVVASITAAYVAVQRNRESISRELAMQSVQQLENDPELSLRLALHATDSAGTQQAEEALRRALGESKVLTTFFTPDQVFTARYSSTGRTILVVSGREVVLWKQDASDMPVLRHPSMVSTAEFSADAGWVATGSWDGKARVWNAVSGEMVAEMQVVEANPDPALGAPGVDHVGFSPDARLLLTVGGPPVDSSRRVAHVWDVKTGARVSELKGHTEAIEALDSSPDGKRVVTGGWDNTARIWDPATGALLRTLAHPGVVDAVAFSPDGALVVSGSADGTVRTWNAATGQLQAVSGQPKAARQLQRFDRLVSISSSTRRALIRDRAEATVYDPHTGKALQRVLDFPSSCPKAVFSRDDRLLACPGQEGTAFVWDVDSGQRIAAFRGHRGELNDLSFSPDGQVLLTAGTDSTVRAWTLAQASQDLTLTGHDQSVNAATWSPDGQLVATAGEDGTARVWDARTGHSVSVLSPAANGDAVRVGSVSFSPDSRRLLVATRGRRARFEIWDARAGTIISSLPAGERSGSTFDGAEWTADESVVIGGSLVELRAPPLPTPAFTPTLAPYDSASRGDLLRWDARSGRALPAIPAQAQASMTFGRVMCGYSRAAGLACLKTDDGTVSRIWDVRSATQVGELKGHLSGVFVTAMSADGQLVALSDQDRVEIWETRTGRMKSQIPGRENYAITGLEFDLSGALLVTAGGQREPVARVWDTSSGQLVRELHGHTHTISSARFSPDGRLIVTASQDSTARVWRLEDGQGVAVLRGHRNMLFDALFSPDGRRILTAGADATARLYDVSLAKPLPELLQLAGQRHTRQLTPDEIREFLH